jgi:hypothetical protein
MAQGLAPVRIAHVVPAYGQRVHVQVAMAFAREAAWCESQGHMHVPFFTDMIGVDRARNVAVSTALRAKCDLLLMQDADTYALPEHNYSALACLTVTMQQRDAAVVGAAVAHRSGDKMCCEPARPGEIYEGKVGTGLMLIDLRKLADMPRPWFVYAVADDGESVRIGEDLYFCQRVKAAGHRVLVDYTVATGHVASVIVPSIPKS